MITLDYLITAFIVVLVPGTGVLLTISTGLTLGRRASIMAALGCTAGIVPHLLATLLGLAAVLHVSARAFQVFKLAGAAYLLYLAYAIWRDKGALSVGAASQPSSGRRLIVRAFLLNILNPKLSLFFLAFLPQFLVPDTSSPFVQLLSLSAVFMGMTLLVFVLYGLLANVFRQAVIDAPRVQGWMRRGFSVAFATLGLNLALAER